MKPFFTLSVLLLALSAAVLSGCATSDESATDPVSFPDPSPVDIQERMQQMHSDVLRREF